MTANQPAGNQGAEAWTIGRLLAWTQQHLEARSVDEPRLSAELLLAEAIGCRRIDLYARFADEPTDEQRAAFRQMVIGAAEHKPVAYLIGHKEFYSLDFKVTPDVLIPRPETELLVERALQWRLEHEQERYDVLDLCTGSGCVAVAIAKRQPTVFVVATDISEKALAVAAENAERHDVADRVRCLRADMLDLPDDAAPESGFDIILANPPYVAEADRETLPPNVRKHEPALALYAGEDGLDAYRRIAGMVSKYLRSGGAVIVEVGYDQAEAVEAIMTADAGARSLTRHKDLAGIDRVIQFTLPE